MLQTRKTKMCLVGDMLSGGGAERAHAALSVYFAGKGIEVHNVIVVDSVTYSYAGELFNLGKEKNRTNGVLNKFRRLRLLRNYIKKQGFDFIIDFRMRRKPVQDLFIARLIFTAPTVYTVHSSNIDWYMPPQSWLTRMIYEKSYGIAALNHKMKEHIEQRHGLRNVTVLYNIIDSAHIEMKLAEKTPEEKEYDYILAAGRMGDGNNVKQFDKLIMAYANSALPSFGVKLVILGVGSEKEKLPELAASLGLTDKIIFKGFQENPYVYMRDALFFVLSSRFEGMPMVVMESLACGIPVVAFDCFTGPSEIIDNRVNGLLIENQDFERLTEGLNTMYSDKELYTHCKANARKSTDKFLMENVGRCWMEYLKIDK